MNNTTESKVVDLRTNKAGPISLYEEVVRRLSYTDVYTPMSLSVFEIRKLLAPYNGRSFEYKEADGVTTIYLANENRVVIALSDGRSINIDGEDTVYTMMSYIVNSGGDLDNAASTTLFAVRALRALMTIEPVPIKLPTGNFIYGAAWLQDNIVAGLRDDSLFANLTLTGKDLLDRLDANNTMVENIVMGNEVVKISKITGGGPNRALITYELRFGVMLDVDCNILNELVSQIRFTPDAQDIVHAGIKIATFLEAIKDNPARPIVMVQEITTQG